MRIIFLTSSNNSSGGGRQALYLASGMAERGHDVTFFASPESMLRPLAPTLAWADLPDKRSQWRKTLESAIRPGEPTIVHAFHNKAVKSLAWSGTLWRMAGKPVACVAHRGVIYRPNNFFPYILPGIRIFAVNSEACLKTLPLFWRKDAGRVIYNCVPDSKITPERSKDEVREELGITPETTLLGCVGNNAPVKGLSVLFTAFSRMKREGRVLCAIGLSPEKW